MIEQFYPEQVQSISKLCEHFGRLLKCPIQPPQVVENGFLVAQLDTSSFMEDILFKREEKRLSPIIPLVFSGWHTFDVEETRSLHKALQDFNPQQSIAVLILFDDQHVIDGARSITEDKLRAYGIDVLVMGRRELEQVFNNSNPASTFRSFMLSRIDITRISPYVVAGPVSDLIFSGREIELRTIAERITNGSYFLIGGRRLGKTSILFRLHIYRLRTMGFYTIYHDCSTTPTPDRFLDTSIRDWKPESPMESTITFGDLLESQLDIPPLVLLLDEADKLIPYDRAQNWPLFSKLRALSNSGYIRVILSGERVLRDAIQDASSPFFNFADEMTIGPLDLQATEELVTRPMKQLEVELINEKVIVDQIHQFTSGHPNIIQRLCRHLLQRTAFKLARSIALEDVNAVIGDPDFQENEFLNIYWERATPLEQILTLLMVREPKPYRLQAVIDLLTEEGISSEPETVKAALDRLVNLRFILKRGPAGYEFAVKAFPSVLTDQNIIDDLFIVLKSQYSKNPMEKYE